MNELIMVDEFWRCMYAIGK